MFKVSDKNNRRTEYRGHVLACLNVVQPVTVSLSLSLSDTSKSVLPSRGIISSFIFSSGVNIGPALSIVLPAATEWG